MTQETTLLEAAIYLRDDLLDRAKWDKETKVVVAGSGAWIRFNDAIDAALTNPTDCCAKTQEACAKVAEEHFADEHWNSAYAAAGHSIATAIRKGADT